VLSLVLRVYVEVEGVLELGWTVGRIVGADGGPLMGGGRETGYGC
jgi:hypothetical protein